MKSLQSATLAVAILGGAVLALGQSAPIASSPSDEATALKNPAAPGDHGPGVVASVPEDYCPPDSLFSQPRHEPDDPDTWIGVSDGAWPFVRFESFSGVTEDICDVHWWGVEADTTPVNCVRPTTTFEIKFYTDSGGQPGAEVYADTVTATRVDTGLLWAPGGYDLVLYEYSTVLSPCYAISDGWLSIQAVGGTSACMFWWQSASTGDGGHWTDDGGGLVWEGDWDASFCLTPEPEPEPKWSQLPHGPGEGFDAASDFWWNELVLPSGQIRSVWDDDPSRKTKTTDVFSAARGSADEPSGISSETIPAAVEQQHHLSAQPLGSRNVTCNLIDFEGIPDNTPVGTIVGTPNVTFGSSWLGLIDVDAGGNGNFANEPSPDTTAYFLTPAEPIDFDAGVQFVEVFYSASAISVPVTLTAWDAPGGTGNIVDTTIGNTVGTSHDGAPCTGDPDGAWCLWDVMQLTSATNNIRSVTLSGAVEDQFGFDNMTFCTDVPPTGACCVDNGSCVVTTEANCASLNGDWLGEDVPCLGDGNGNGIDDACEEEVLNKVMADDFQSDGRPIKAVRWWGSNFAPEDQHDCDPPGVCGSYVECGDPPPWSLGCYCGKRTDETGRCFDDSDSCDVRPTCFNGDSDCPSGMWCLVDSCCYDPVCTYDCGNAPEPSSARDMDALTPSGRPPQGILYSDLKPGRLVVHPPPDAMPQGAEFRRYQAHASERSAHPPVPVEARSLPQSALEKRSLISAEALAAGQAAATRAQECSGDPTALMFPLDGTYSLVDFCADGPTGSDPAECVPGAGAQNNDDDSATVPLAFTFDLYGDLYSTAYVNNNGNLSFVTYYSDYTAEGFPSANYKMVAPFWADVDTGNQSTVLIGDVWMKQYDSNVDTVDDTVIVTWDNVGYFNEHGDLLNTFQVAISDGTNPVMGLGNNVCFSWDNMCWTTGDASGGVGGFGGSPAIVGANRGDGVDYFQIGAFDHEGIDYDGPYGSNDGVSYLDYGWTCFSTSDAINVAPIPGGFPPGNTITVDAGFGQVLDSTVQFISPEPGQTVTVNIVDVDGAQAAGLVIVNNSPGLEVATTDLDWTPDCGDTGWYALEFTATDDFNPPGVTDVVLNINVKCTELIEPDGWFISFHHDQVQNPGCPPDLAGGDPHPTALGVYFCPAESVEIGSMGYDDCLDHPVFEYEVDLSECCLLCSEEDPRSPGYYPAQPEEFLEEAEYWYWLDIQAVAGVTWDPTIGCTYDDRILTEAMPTTQHFWGWHTSPDYNRYTACTGEIYDFSPYPPACWDYGEWDVPAWECPEPEEPVHMAFELLADPILVPDPPDPPPGEPGYDKIRYISFVPSAPGVQTAIRVTLTTMPPPYAGFSGQQMWVGAALEKCENGGVSTPPCPPVPPLNPSYQSANLQCTPNCMDYGSVGALHVTDDEIIPNAVYDVQMIDCSSDFGIEASYSDPLTIGTSIWADLVIDCTTTPCGPPDGSTGIVDVTAVLDKFKNLPIAVMKSRADIDPNLPDWLVNITDVTFCLDAFLGFPYPPTGWTGPGGCP